MDFLRQVGQVLFQIFSQIFSPPSLLSWQALVLVLLLLVLLTFWIFNFSFSTLQEAIKNTKTLGEVRDTLKPPTWDSWQCLIWISVFSWAVSLLAESNWVQGLIASIAWIFLIAGVHWAMHDKEVTKRLTFNKLFIAPWITGGLLSVFLFGGLFDRDPSYVFVYWFPLAATIAILPKFIKNGPDWKKPEPSARQEIVILALMNLLVSCWFQLYFSTQIWAQKYPNLFPQTVDIRPPQTVATPAQVVRSTGVAFLDQAGIGLQTNLSGLPWPQVERWLINLNPNLIAISDAAKLKLGADSEPWRLEGKVLPGQEYRVQLWAIWRDPTTKRDREYLIKTCAITRTPGNSAIPASSVARVQCGSVETPTIAPKLTAPTPTVRTVR